MTYVIPYSFCYAHKREPVYIIIYLVLRVVLIVSGRFACSILHEVGSFPTCKSESWRKKKHFKLIICSKIKKCIQKCFRIKTMRAFFWRSKDNRLLRYISLFCLLNNFRTKLSVYFFFLVILNSIRKNLKNNISLKNYNDPKEFFPKKGVYRKFQTHANDSYLWHFESTWSWFGWTHDLS